MAILNKEKALRTLRKAPHILDYILRDVGQQQAILQPADRGWSVLYVMCHIRDYETIFYERARMMFSQDNPTFPRISNEDLIQKHEYNSQNLHDVLSAYIDKRREFIEFLQELTDEQWFRPGIHPATGETTILSLAINTGLHDINHIGQIIEVLNH